MIERDYVLKYLQDKQETEGGYTGNDLTAFAKDIGIPARITNVNKNNKTTFIFIYGLSYTLFVVLLYFNVADCNK